MNRAWRVNFSVTSVYDEFNSYAVVRSRWHVVFSGSDSWKQKPLPLTPETFIDL